MAQTTHDIVESQCRLRLHIQGVVQGVGFRPLVYKIAHQLDLTVLLRNDPDGVRIEIQGLLV